MFYKKVLLALEMIAGDDPKIINKAKEMLDARSELYLIHSVEYVSNYAVMPSGIDFEACLIKEAEKAMQKLGASLKVPEERQIVKMGPAKLVILEEAKRIQADLIILGSHGRHGVSLLLGSTANAVLHKADCDVLAVRVGG